MRSTAAMTAITVAVLLTVLFSASPSVPSARAVPPAAAPPSGTPSGLNPSGRVDQQLVVLAGGWRFDEVDRLISQGQLPALKRLIEHGAIGLMNTNTAVDRTPWHGSLSLGTGASARASRRLAAEPGNRREPQPTGTTGDLFRRRTGFEVAGSQIVHPGIAELTEINAPLPVGRLGDALHRAGHTTAVIGNADTSDQRARYAVQMVMDSKGRVDAGIVSRRSLMEDPHFPGGLRTDWRTVTEAALQATQTHTLTVVETGDLLRLQHHADKVSDAVMNRYRQQFYLQLDRFLAEILATASPAMEIWVLSTAPSEPMRMKGDALTLAVASGGRFETAEGPVRLWSASTRRPGLFTNRDVAPSLLNGVGISPPSSMGGLPLTVDPRPSGWTAWNNLGSLKDYTLANHLRRGPLLRTSIIATGLIVLIALSAIFMLPASRQQPLKQIVRFLPVLPWALLVLPVFPVTGTLSSAAVVLLLGVGLHALAVFVSNNRPLPYLGSIAAVTALSIALDLAWGGVLQIASPMGYSPIGGARFYGVGNEFMGVFLGSSWLAATVAVPHFKKYLWIPFSLAAVATTLILGLPSLGSNFGGMLAAAGAGAAVTMTWNDSHSLDKRFRLRPLMVTLGSVLALSLIGIVLAGQLSAASPTHIMTALQGAVSSEGESLWPIIERKLSMNWSLIQYTFWTRVFLALLAAFGFLLYRPRGLFAAVLKQHPGLRTGLTGLAAATLTALIVNDSGIVAAATAMIFGAVPVVVLNLGVDPAEHAGLSLPVEE